MNGPVFADTNVLLYQWDAADPDKQRRAAEWMKALWSSRRGRLSFQVLSEFYVAATHKIEPAVERETARRYVRTLFAWEPVAADAALVEAAWRVQERLRLSWWDALILAAAHRSGCRTLLSEDFQDGRSYDEVTVVNPFHRGPESLA